MSGGSFSVGRFQARASLISFLAVLVFIPQFAAAQYSVTVLHPVSAYASSGQALTSSTQGGFVRPTPGDPIHAAVWNGSAGSVIDLHQSIWTEGSLVNGVSGNASVGYALSSSGNEQALLWTNQTAASAVSLHLSSGYNSTIAQGIDGNTQVGFGLESAGGYERALMWNGSAASVTELHPQNVAGNSAAYSVLGNSQVGYLEDFSVPVVNGYEHASLWHGTAASRVDLHPTSNNYDLTIAYGLDATHQVGWGQVANGIPLHALLWSGSAASVVDLNPSNYYQSYAYGVAGNLQVGVGEQTFGGLFHALLWSGSANSVVDLHSFLPSGYAQSWATGIDPITGNIIGVAFQTNTDVNGIAVMWTPVLVPEPSTWALLGLGLGTLGMIRRRSRRLLS